MCRLAATGEKETIFFFLLAISLFAPLMRRIARWIKKAVAAKEYDTRKSSLLAELTSRKRPLVLCHERGAVPHFIIDLDERVFCHATLSTTSDTFFVDYDQTSDDIVVFTGSTLDGNAPWEVRIARRKGSGNASKYVADVIIDEDGYYKRISQ